LKQLGDVLKDTRIEKGMTLQDISNITKISVRYLNGIENGDWSMMPGNFYVKGFIRSYAKALKIDINPLLAELDIESKEDKTKVPSNIKTTTSNPVRANRFGKLFSLSLVVILILVVFFTIFYYASNLKLENNNEFIDNQSTDYDNALEPSVLEPLPQKEQEIVIEGEKPIDLMIELVEQQGNTHLYRVSNATEYSLRLESNKGTCWYEVRAINGQGNIINTSTLRNGDTQELTFNDNIWVRLGNPDSVDIFINNQLVDKVVTSSNPRNYQFELLR
jgi:transcriptional regulator with XRE-family HTH domain